MPNADSSFVRVDLPPRRLNRRQFLYTTTLAAGALAVSSRAAVPAKLRSANGKLDMAAIGTAGKGGDDAANFATENIVALCDVNADALGAAAKKWPQARLYRDYRILLEKENHLDAVTIGIPDHH